MQTVVQHESYHANPGPAGQLSCKLWSSRKVIMQTLAQQDSYPATMVQHESYNANTKIKENNIEKKGTHIFIYRVGS